MIECLKMAGPLWRLVGTKGAVLFGVTLISSMTLALIECVFAAFMVVFLCSLHLVAYTELPKWLPFNAEAIGPVRMWVILFGVGVAQAIAHIANYQAKVLFSEGTHARMRLVLGYRLLLSHDTRSMALSELNLYMAEFFPKASLFIFYITQAMSFVVQALLLSVGMFLLAPGESALGIFALWIVGYLVMRSNTIMTRFANRIPRAQEDLERTKVRIARNWLLIRIFGVQRREFDGWVRSVYSYFRHGVLAYFVGNLGGALLPVFGIVIVAAILQLSRGVTHTPVTALLAFLYLFMRFLQMVSHGSNLIGGLFTYRPHVAKTLALVQSLMPDELNEALTPGRGFRLGGSTTTDPWKPGLPGSVLLATKTAPMIRVENVTFEWPGSAGPILKGVSFELQAGCQLGIVGPNGCGKSTLLGLILGAFLPTNGRVLMDGRDSAEYLRDSSHAIAYVGPEPYLIHGSVRENLLYGLAGGAPEAELWDALREVGMDEFFRTLPDGLDYPIQENGDGLSSGQKQRLAMARSFLRRPALFIMDEPSANLDAATETCILQALRKMKGICTVLVVSHRPTMLSDADRVMTLDGESPEGR